MDVKYDGNVVIIFNLCQEYGERVLKSVGKWIVDLMMGYSLRQLRASHFAT